jgi:glutamate N-acetyltransferase/amino-acid N-acetyltransferase
MKEFASITQPKGFLAAGISCGLKKSGRKDLALIFSQSPAQACGLFTANKVKAAPLLVSIAHLKNNQAQAVIINSANANCYTGKQGFIDAEKMASLTAETLGLNNNDVLVASTGIIAKPLAMEKIIPGIKKLCLNVSKKGGQDAAYAIQTTDKCLKQALNRLKISGKTVTIGAMAKGAGMIFPNLKSFNHATMLAFITTDAKISVAALKKALEFSVDDSFNAITVDGCMSTNDSVLILANNQAQNKIIEYNSNDFFTFRNALNEICKALAKKIVMDAEGATKFIQIKIVGAKNARLARQAGFSIANSALFKTACFGENRNLGRIISALGSIGISLDEKKTKIKLSPLDKRNINLDVFLGQGKASSIVYTCDFSPEYVKINAGYS